MALPDYLQDLTVPLAYLQDHTVPLAFLQDHTAPLAFLQVQAIVLLAFLQDLQATAPLAFLQDLQAIVPLVSLQDTVLLVYLQAPVDTALLIPLRTALPPLATVPGTLEATATRHLFHQDTARVVPALVHRLAMHHPALALEPATNTSHPAATIQAAATAGRPPPTVHLQVDTAPLAPTALLKVPTARLLRHTAHKDTRLLANTVCRLLILQEAAEDKFIILQPTVKLTNGKNNTVSRTLNYSSKIHNDLDKYSMSIKVAQM